MSDVLFYKIYYPICNIIKNKNKLYPYFSAWTCVLKANGAKIVNKTVLVKTEPNVRIKTVPVLAQKVGQESTAMRDLVRKIYGVQSAKTLACVLRKIQMCKLDVCF